MFLMHFYSLELFRFLGLFLDFPIVEIFLAIVAELISAPVPTKNSKKNKILLIRLRPF